MGIKVGFYKLDDRSVDRFRIVFKMVFKKQCEVSEIGEASIVIVNVDEHTASEIVNDFTKQYADMPVILLSDKAVEIKGIPCLIRPCKLSELLELIKQNRTQPKSSKASASKLKKASHSADILEKKMQTSKQFTRTAKIANTKDDSIFYQPQNFLQGKLESAIKKANENKKSVFLRCWSHRWIVVCSTTGCLIANIKESQLSNLGLVSIDNDVIFREESFNEMQLSDMSETPVNGVKVIPTTTFMWDLAVRTSRGRIPKGTSCDDLYVLESWPNLTRVSRIANAMRISAFWLDQPQSIDDISRKLKIPVEDVYTYFSASRAIGILKLAKRKEDNLVVPDLAKAEPLASGIISAILRKLSWKKSSTSNQGSQ